MCQVNCILPTLLTKLIVQKVSYLILNICCFNLIFIEIALISTNNEQNKLVLGTSFGNKDLKCNSIDESISVLKYGLKIDEQYHSKPIMMKSTSARPWSDDYHTFELSWSNYNIVFKIDGESHQLDTSNLPLDLIFDSDVY